MILRAGTVAALLTLTLAQGASAQVLLGPRPGDPYGFRFSYKSGGLIVSGSLGGGYYPGYPPAYYQQTTILTPPPRITINNNYYGGYPPVLGSGYDQDTRGIDLDALPVKKPAPREPDEPYPKKVDSTPVKPLPGIDVSKSKPSVRPGDGGQPEKQPGKEPERPAPEWPRPPDLRLPDPRDESARLMELGLFAFQVGEYGLAAQRFRQAIEVMPAVSRPYFLLAQAEVALGKYRDAVDTIHSGMKLDKQWPRIPVQPRLDLYKGRDADFLEHLKRLTDSAAVHPNNGTLLFLVGHQLWFDGQRKDALAVFQRARGLVKDRANIDAFLAAGGPGGVAGP